ncbi:MAG: TonB-dependent receptor [Gemmatimonadetes bacterium]|nr:TonB-dependent receptor [Gemmatimonadota bacterium]
MTPLLLALGLLLQQGTVFGWVRAEGSLEPIAFASVDIGGRAVLTDEHGYYVAPGVAAGEVLVRAAMLGYRTGEASVVVPASGSIRADLLLAPAPVRLEEIRVGGTAEEIDAVTTAGSPPIRIDAATLEYVPALAEKDALRAVQMLPSVAAASDFSSALYIRGGSPDQSVVLVDGAPIFNPYHVGGIFSAIDPDAVATLEVMPGGMPASEADRASGVVKVWTKDGGRDRLRGHGAVGLVSSRLGVDGPLPWDGGSYIISGRRTYFDLMTKAAYELGVLETPFPYSFTDVHAKITQDVGLMGRLNVSGYINDEGITVPREVEPDSRTSFSWGTRAGSVSYRQPLGPSLLANLTLAGTSFDGDFVAAELTEEAVMDTAFLGRITMRDLVADASLTFYGGDHRLKAGIQLDDYTFRYQFRVGNDDVTGGDLGDEFGGIFARLGEAAGIVTVAAYLEDSWSIGDAFSVRLGARALHAEGLGTEIMPRLGARWTLRPGLALTAAAGRYAQAIHSLRDEESVLASIIPYELLLPAQPETGMLVAEDLIAGLELARPNTKGRFEAYLKRYPSLPTPPLSPDPAEAPIFAPAFLPGTGSAAGLEAFVQHRFGPNVLMGSYALNWAKRSADGVTYTPRYNRRQLLDITAAREWGDDGLLTARFALGSGQPYTPAVGRLDAYVWDPIEGLRPAGSTVVLGEPNSRRLPAYMRLDLGARTELHPTWFGREVTLSPYLQILNILGNENVTAGQPRYNFEGNGEIEYLPALPLLPTFGIEWKF